MRTKLISFLILTFVFVPHLVSAQNWTPDEQAILDKVYKALAAWEEAVEKKDYSIWLKGANPMEDNCVWFTTASGPRELKNSSQKSFETRFGDVLAYELLFITPLKIEVHDNVGFFWFYNNSLYVDDQGNRKTMKSKRFEVFKKIDGEWRWWAGMVTPDED
jgi:ketosteroid isomerase-like protein